jgi:hypothetical protein
MSLFLNSAPSRTCKALIFYKATSIKAWPGYPQGRSSLEYQIQENGTERNSELPLGCIYIQNIRNVFSHLLYSTKTLSNDVGAHLVLYVLEL